MAKVYADLISKGAKILEEVMNKNIPASVKAEIKRLLGVE